MLNTKKNKKEYINNKITVQHCYLVRNVRVMIDIEGPMS